MRAHSLQNAPFEGLGRLKSLRENGLSSRAVPF